MKAVLKYPPDFDGELYFEVQEVSKGLLGHHLDIKVKISLKPNETVRDALRRMGKDLTLQPLYIYP